MIDYTLILTYMYQGKQWILNGDDYSGLIWLSDSPKPSKKTLEDLWPEVQAKIESDFETKTANKAALLERLGITAEEAALLVQ